ncbi:MAG: glycine C-acetyltransferase [Sphingomonadales bacterium]
MSQFFVQHLRTETKALRDAGLYKSERVIRSPQRVPIAVSASDSGDGEREVLNFCANNYLGLADNPALVAAAKEALDNYGFGMASVRFICGTQKPHKDLEARISEFLGTEDTILYSSCFDANTGLFETILDDRDAVISDALNHASIIDGIRLCKARRLRYANNDMSELEAKLKEAQDCRFRLIATDGVFSMDGVIANLSAICDLAEKYDALVMVDDSHAVGVLGGHGGGSPDYCGVVGRIDIITGTLGKALGGASGGYTSGRKEVIEWLRQRSRPYLFSNAVAPAVTGASIRAIELLRSSSELRDRLHENAGYMRQGLEAAGFTLVPGRHPIVPVMIGDAGLAGRMADALLEEGIYVIGFSFPVVPKGQARIRLQLSAAHTREQLDRAVAAFIKVGRVLGIIS